MKKLFLTLITIHLSLFTLHAQSWLWAVQASNTTNSDGEGWGSATDNSGNTYVTGEFEYNMYFGTTSLNTPSASFDAYLAKYNSSGTMVWAIQSNTPSSTSYCEAVGVATDAWGNVFMAGNYEDTATFGAFLVHDVTPPYYLDGMYITRISPGGGYVWVRQSKALNASCGGNIGAVATDKTGNVYITGNFFNTEIFGKDTLVASAGSCFLVKYDSAGNELWAKQSTGNFAYGQGLSTDRAGNIYITGYFYSPVSFGTHTLTTLNNDMFVVKYSPAGNVIWAAQSNAASASSYVQGNAIANDKNGNAYVTGYFYDTASIGTHSLKVQHDTDAFVARFDSNGSVAWVVQAYNKDNNDWLGYAISADTLNHVFVAFGGFGAKEKNANIELVVGADTFKTYNAGFDDASVIAILDTTGSTFCGIITPSTGDDRNSVSCDPSGQYVYLSGDLGTTATFGPDVLTFNYSEAPMIARFKPCSTVEGINELKVNSEEVKVFPNPNNGEFQLGIRNEEIGMKCNAQVYDMLGRQIYSSGFLIPNSQFLINLSGQPNGVYLYRVTDEGGNVIGTGKFIISK